MGSSLFVFDLFVFKNGVGFLKYRVFFNGPSSGLKKTVYSESALTGQTSVQAPHSAQVASSTVHLSSTMVRALHGQVSTQAPQPMHSSLLTLTAIMNSPLEIKITKFAETTQRLSN